MIALTSAHFAIGFAFLTRRTYGAAVPSGTTNDERPDREPSLTRRSSGVFVSLYSSFTAVRAVSGARGALVIGDPALSIEGKHRHVLDLGEWHERARHVSVAAEHHGHEGAFFGLGVGHW